MKHTILGTLRAIAVLAAAAIPTFGPMPASADEGGYVMRFTFRAEIYTSDEGRHPIWFTSWYPVVMPKDECVRGMEAKGRDLLASMSYAAGKPVSGYEIDGKLTTVTLTERSAEALTLQYRDSREVKHLFVYCLPK